MCFDSYAYLWAFVSRVYFYSLLISLCLCAAFFTDIDMMQLLRFFLLLIFSHGVAVLKTIYTAFHNYGTPGFWRHNLVNIYTSFQTKAGDNPLSRAVRISITYCLYLVMSASL